MKRTLLFLSLGFAMAVPTMVWADDNSPVTVPATPPPQWSLEVSQDHVAAGALPGDEHHCEFIIRARDANGAPLAGVPVELPHIWGDGGELGATYPDNPAIVMPHVEWHSSGKTALTDAKGEARGRFTSGALTGSVVLRGPGATLAKIDQVWNDDADPYKEWGYGARGNLEEHCFIMTLQVGDKTLPITGHHIEQTLKWVILSARRPTGALDENGQPQFDGDWFDWKIKRPGTEASLSEWARWETVSSWFQLGQLKECEPGHYRGTRLVSEFGDGDSSYRILDGLEIGGISDYHTFTEDEGVYVGDNDSRYRDDDDDD